jgi:polyisoprenoid-binding protein YceI
MQQFTLDVSSIDTNQEQRDGHLKSADFFDAEQFPKISFKSTSFKKVGDDYELSGDLTLKNVSKSVKLNVEYGGRATDFYGNDKAGF